MPTVTSYLSSRSSKSTSDASGNASHVNGQDAVQPGGSEGTSSLHDRLISKVLEQVFPKPTSDLDRNAASSEDVGVNHRPGFSLPVMTSNFRQFNARIGIVFVCQKHIQHLLSWRTPSHTLSLLATVTFICMNPYLLSLLPLLCIILFILVPGYLARHPPPPDANVHTYKLGGPPIAPARTIKPASEMSKDFLRNMRDLQNSMADFCNVHDAVVQAITLLTNFSNDALSSGVFAVLFTLTLWLSISAHLVPWNMVVLLFFYATICGGHPKIRAVLAAHKSGAIARGRASARSWLDMYVKYDYVLDGPAEKREVEIFELQHRDPQSQSDEWEAWLFTASPFDPLSPQRISGSRPKGTRFFDDVQAPRGWQWAAKKWTPDMHSRAWVEDRMVQSVEVDIEGERWVTDISSDSADTCLGIGSKKQPSSSKSSGPMIKVGRWRRRRWVRLVERQQSSQIIQPLVVADSSS